MVRSGWRTVAWAAAVATVLVGAPSCTANGSDPASSSTTTAPTEQRRYRSSKQCPVARPRGVAVDCGWVTVPADRSDPASADLRLRVARVHARNGKAKRDPIVIIEGGPGFGSLDRIDLYAHTTMAEDHDLILWDQRGTGYSKPPLACPNSDVEADDWDAQCRDELAKDGIDLGDYNSVAIAEDLEDVRSALDIDRWNLFGTSYGTVIAQQSIRAHPDSARSVLLTSAVPMDRPFEPTLDALTASYALADLDEACRADGGCHARYGDLTDLLDKAIRAGGIDGSGDSSGVRRSVKLAMYETGSLGHLPTLMAAVVDAPPGPEVARAIGAIDAMWSHLFDDRSEIQARSVICSDRNQRYVDDDETCNMLDVKALPAAFNKPLNGTKVPVLVVGGRFDPITPPKDGRAVATSLGAPFVEVVASHDAITASRCADRIWLSFLDDPKAPLDDACLAQQPPIDFS